MIYFWFQRIPSWFSERKTFRKKILWKTWYFKATVSTASIPPAPLRFQHYAFLNTYIIHVQRCLTINTVTALHLCTCLCWHIWFYFIIFYHWNNIMLEFTLRKIIWKCIVTLSTTYIFSAILEMEEILVLTLIKNKNLFSICKQPNPIHISHADKNLPLQ